MKKIIFSFAALTMIMVSCDSDDDSSVAEVTTTAATLIGGPYEFCVDGITDTITDDVISDAGTGSLQTFVVTDENKNILGLPGAASGPDFDGAGVGTCYLYYINYEEGIVGLTGPDASGVSTSNLDDLEGEFSLSNFLIVNREDCDTSIVAATLVAGASAVDGEYTFTVGDGEADNVTDLVVEDAGAGEFQQIVVTSDDGWILGLPPVFEGPNFDGAGVGVCYLRHLNYNGSLVGLTGPDDEGNPTANINDLEGDFKISNIIFVNRVAAEM